MGIRDNERKDQKGGKPVYISDFDTSETLLDKETPYNRRKGNELGKTTMSRS